VDNGYTNYIYVVYACFDFETRALFLHVRGEVEMGRILSCNQHRLPDQKCRLDRLHLRSDNWELRQHHQQEEDEDRDQALALVATAEER